MAQRADREKEEVKRREAEERLEQAKLEEAVRRSEEEAKVREAGLLFRGIQRGSTPQCSVLSRYNFKCLFL